MPLEGQKEPAAQAKQAALVAEKRRQEEGALLAALSTDLGYSKAGKPLAALVTFRACLQWRAFQADRTSVFDRIIQVRVLCCVV